MAIIKLVYAHSGVRSMFAFLTREIDLAYVGLTPYLLLRSYGVPVKIVGIAQHYGRGVGVALRDEAQTKKRGVAKIATVFGSGDHQVVRAWERRSGVSVSLVNLEKPADRLKALKYGVIDGVATFEPFLTSCVELGARRVAHADDLEEPGYNVICASQAALDGLGPLIKAFLVAVGNAVAKICARDLDDDALSYLSRMFGGQIKASSWTPMLCDAYDWPQIGITELASDPGLLEAIQRTHAFLRSERLVGPDEVEVAECFASQDLAASTSGGDTLKVGYTESAMCAPFFLAQTLGLLDDQGLTVDTEERRLIERVAQLQLEFGRELEAAEHIMDIDPQGAFVPLVRLSEEIWRRVYTAAFGPKPPHVTQILSDLEQGRIAPKQFLLTTQWIRSVPQLSPDEGTVTRVEAMRAHRSVLELAEWFEGARATFDEGPRRCRSCLQPGLGTDDKVCPICGTNQQLDCRKCGALLKPGFRYCMDCGTSVHQPVNQGGLRGAD